MSNINQHAKDIIKAYNQLAPVDTTALVVSLEQFNEFFQDYCSKHKVPTETRERIFARLIELREGLNNFEDFVANLEGMRDDLEEFRTPDRSREQS